MLGMTERNRGRRARSRRRRQRRQPTVSPGGYSPAITKLQNREQTNPALVQESRGGRHVAGMGQRQSAVGERGHREAVRVLAATARIGACLQCRYQPQRGALAATMLR